MCTLDQLHEKPVSFDKTPDKALAYTKRYLKQMLEEHFKERIFTFFKIKEKCFASQERRTDVLSFKDLTASIIQEHHNNKEDDDKTKIIKSAVKLIQNDIALVNINSFRYPSINAVTDLDGQLKLMPDSLKLFLKPLLKQDRRFAFWGQSTIKTSRSRSGMLPLPMCFAFQLEHGFGFRWLLDEMHSLEFSESYHEVSNYKYCYICNNIKVKIQSSNSLETIVEEEEPEDDNIINAEMLLLDNCEEEIEHTNIETSTSLTTAYSGAEYVSDNIDLNIVSVNGDVSFHATCMIRVNTKSFAVTDNYLSSEIPRRRTIPADKAIILKAGDIPIRHCRDFKKTGINSIKLKPIHEMIDAFSSTLSNPNHADTLWTAGWIIKKKDKVFSHANWNGWMKSIHNSEGKEANHIEYQPIIDGDPNDQNTIYTALLQRIEKEKPNISMIAFDLPLCLNSVDIILSRNHPIIPRLGGFYLFKFFLGTFGAMFADSGLCDILQLIYPGEIAADSILSGSSYGKAIRAHFLIDAATIQHVVTLNMFTDAELSAM